MLARLNPGRNLLRVMVGLLLLALACGPASPALVDRAQAAGLEAAGLPPKAHGKTINRLQIKFVTPPPKKICVYNFAQVAYNVTEWGLRPASGAVVKVGASRGQITNAVYSPYSGIGSFTYHAKARGDDTVTVVAEYQDVRAVAKLTVKVSGCGYRIRIQALNLEKDGDTRMFQTLDGSGNFEVDDSGNIHGNGSLSYRMSLWGVNQAIACAFDPDVEGTSSFQVNNSAIASLIAGEEDLQIDLQFEPAQVNATTLTCKILIDDNITINPIPFPASQYDPNELGLRVMNFPPMGGTYKFKFGKGDGVVSVIPKISK